MKSALTYSLTCCLIWAAGQACGQGIKDTVHQIHDVVILDSIVDAVDRHDKSDNTLVDFSQQEGRRFSEILSDYSGVYLKNYGVGQLSSITINGSSAAQTDVLWNGIKLNSPTSGQVDFSLFDLSGGDRLGIYTTSQNRRSGAIGLGGTVTLDNQLDMGEAKYIKSYNTVRIGSFGERVISSANIYGHNGFRASTKIAFISADNDFPFRNDTKIGAPIVRETNAATKQLSFTQQLQYNFKKPYSIGADLWITDADRQLPPVMTSDDEHEHQWDQSYRVMAYVTGRKAAFDFSFKSAFLYDKLKYLNAPASIDSRSSSQAFRNIFSAGYIFLHGVSLSSEIHYDHEMARSTGFDVVRQRDLMGLNVAASYLHRSGLMAGVSIHGDLQDFHLLPISPGAYIGINKNLRHNNYIVATLNGERNYRIPALNDLYWSEGGNPALLPEKAWKASLHISYGHSYWFKFMADGFYNYVKDWILWVPTTSGPWAPQNVKRVLSRGGTVSLHLQSKSDLNDKGFVVSAYAGYTYTKTTSLDAMSGNDNSQGKQLIYVPLHNVTANLKIQYRRFYIKSIHSFTGERFTTTDNSQSLKPYYLTHLEAGKDFYFYGQQIGLSFRVNNVANTPYQAIENRPMPGRYYEATVRINLAK